MRLEQERDSRHVGGQGRGSVGLGRRPVTGELEEVTALVPVEPQRRGEGIDPVQEHD
jgi:hypothetical protein